MFLFRKKIMDKQKMDTTDADVLNKFKSGNGAPVKQLSLYVNVL